MVRPNVKSVLIVEDAPHFRLALSAILEGEGYQVFEAHSAGDAVEQLHRGLLPDLILLDLRLPDLSGERFNAELKAHARFSHIPVIVSSAYLDQAFDGSQYAAVFLKPFEPSELLERMRTIFSKCDRAVRSPQALSS